MPPSHFLKIRFNIILTFTPRSSKWYLPLRSPHQNPGSTSPVPLTCHMPRPSPSSWFDYAKNILQGVQSVVDKFQILCGCILLYGKIQAVEVQQYSLGFINNSHFEAWIFKINIHDSHGQLHSERMRRINSLWKNNFKIRITETNWKVVEWTVPEHLFGLFT
jgi:hypothetical protein